MSKESAKQSEKTNIAPQEYCMQLGSSYCRNECPNGCYDNFQALINKLFEPKKQDETPEGID